MKMNLKKMMSEADDSILDDLIASCEAKMSSKFKKEEPEAEVSEVIVASEEPEEGEMDELDEESKLKLLEMYKSLKG